MADGDEYRVESILQEHGSERGMCATPSLSFSIVDMAVSVNSEVPAGWYGMIMVRE